MSVAKITMFSLTRRNKIIYWVTTGLLAFGMLSQGLAQNFHTQGYVDIIVHLGYPTYFLNIIGIWKILGVIAILMPRLKLVKEWAYAGFFFIMSGALVSHIASGDPVIAVAPALVLLSLIVVSWYFRPADRKIISEDQ
jgi:DoxX-like family